MEVMKLNSIRKAREAKGMSQEQLAVAVTENIADRVSQQAVAKWESGESNPRADKLVAIARVLGVTVDELLKED